MDIFNLLYILSLVIPLSLSKTTPHLRASEGAAIPPAYRLSPNVVPSAYDITISLYEDLFNTNRFQGQVEISLELKVDVTEITLHASRMDITSIRLTKNDGSSIAYSSYTLYSDTEFLEISFKEKVAKGKYNLRIIYTGSLISDDMYGFYKSFYVDDKGNQKFLATTQFESTYARRAFPCFDEPNLKAEFSLTFVYPTGYGVIANTKAHNTTDDGNGLITTIFTKSPKMSTYLVAFIVSDFTSESKEIVTVWSKKGTEGNRKIVLDQSPKLLKALADFTTIPYELPKLDVAAIPDFAAGAMENWGLVTFREYLVLDDGDETSQYFRQRIITTVAHEFAHQWFGDLVTLDWWSHTWLNEGFATYFQYFISHSVNPEFELDKQFLLLAQQQIFESDAISSVQPLSSANDAINTPTEISNKFDSISYSKGGSVIRMLSHILGQDEFKKGLIKYLNDNNHLNAVPEKLFSSFEAKNLPKDQNLSTVMNDWIYKSGFPYITVSLKDKKLNIAEERFLLDETEHEAATWFVPLSYTTAKDKNFDATAPTEWLSTEGKFTLSIPHDSEDWVIFNNQATGYYRVSYDKVLWDRIIKALESKDFDGIHELNRAQLVDDVFNLARINVAPYETAFQLSKYLVNETSYHVWSSAFNSFAYLRKRTGSTKLGNAISKMVAGLMQSLNEDLSFDIAASDKVIDILAKAQTLTWACDLANKNCTDLAQSKFEDFKKDKKVDPNLRSVVYCSAIRNSAKPQEDWDFLWKKYAAASAAEKNTILTALGCVKDSAILEEYLSKSINETSGIRKQDGVFAFKAVYSGNPEGVDVAFNFLKTNHEKIAAYYKGMGSLSSILSGIVDRFTTQKQIDDLKQFLENKDLSEEFKIVGNQAVGSATANVQWLQKFEKNLNQIFDLDDGKGDAASIKAGLMLIMALLVSLFYL